MPTPPRRALQFLRWFCDPDLLPEIEGDLQELFGRQYSLSWAKSKVSSQYLKNSEPSTPSLMVLFSTCTGISVAAQRCSKATVYFLR